jgi:hypothetical protein
MARFAWQKMFFDSNLVASLFLHIKNVFYCSFILAIGSYIHDYPPDFLPETPYASYLGYPLITIGLCLFMVNLLDSINHIKKLQYNMFVKIFLSLIHIILTGWLATVAWVFRMR